jgi:hypothetical protein
MSAGHGGRQASSSQIARLVEIPRPQRSPRDQPGSSLPASAGPATGLDDVRAPLSAPSEATPTSGVTRRDLLTWGGAAALLPLLPAAASAATARAAAAPEPLRSMSVGYIEGSDSWRSFDRLSLVTLNRGRRPEPGAEALPFEVVPASQLISGDQMLASELVRVGIHGLYPVPTPQAIARLDLTVLFPSPDPASPAPLPFFAWSYFNKPGPNPSQSLRFTAPLGTDGSFQLLLDVTPAVGPQVIARRSVVGLAPEAPGGSFAADFTVDWYEGRPKLQRGVYLLALGGTTWRSSRTLPVHKPRTPRPLDLLSLIVSFEPIVAE